MSQPSPPPVSSSSGGPLKKCTYRLAGRAKQRRRTVPSPSNLPGHISPPTHTHVLPSSPLKPHPRTRPRRQPPLPPAFSRSDFCIWRGDITGAAAVALVAAARPWMGRARPHRRPCLCMNESDKCGVVWGQLNCSLAFPFPLLLPCLHHHPVIHPSIYARTLHDAGGGGLAGGGRAAGARAGEVHPDLVLTEQPCVHLCVLMWCVIDEPYVDVYMCPYVRASSGRRTDRHHHQSHGPKQDAKAQAKTHPRQSPRDWPGWSGGRGASPSG